MNDKWNESSPESDEVFARKVVEYRLREQVTDLLQERLFDEIQHNKKAEKFVIVSTGEVTITDFELCTICARELAPSESLWTYRACLNCMTFDAVLGEEFEGDMFLPLGRHTVMNGAIIEHDAIDIVQQAQSEGVDVVLAQWESLLNWRSSEVRHLATQAGFKNGDTVTLVQWQYANPPSRQASFDAYLRLLETSHAWVFGLVENARNRDWFTRCAERKFKKNDAA